MNVTRLLTKGSILIGVPLDFGILVPGIRHRIFVNWNANSAKHWLLNLEVKFILLKHLRAQQVWSA
jgi:hypothetical protein